MRRLLIACVLIAWALPATAQNWVSVNGSNTLTATSPQPAIAVRQGGSGYAFCVQSTAGLNLWCIDKTGISTSTVASIFGADAIATTSTDGLTIRNATLATAGVTVQMSPRAKWCGAAWNSTSGLSEADCMFFENLPATVAGTTTSTLKMGVTINGTTAVYPFKFSSVGTLTVGTTGSNGIGLSGTSTCFQSANAGCYLLESDGVVGVNSGVLSLMNGGSGSMVISTTAPTVTSAGTSPSVVANGSVTFRVNVGTGGTATTIVMAMPTATTGWNCSGSNLTAAAANRNPTGVLLQQSSTTTSATIQYQTVATGVALAFVASDVVQIHCDGY